jgi:hypothetical protein
MIIDLFLLSRASGVPQKYRRWSNCREPPVPSRERWDEMCHETTVYCLRVFAAYTDASSKKVRVAQHKSICSTISEIWDGVGVLVANHSIKEKACCLGLLPPWCQEQLATVEPNSRVVKFFNEKYKLRRKLNQLELDPFLATITRPLEVGFDTEFTERIIENLLCKAFRELSNKDQKEALSWCDTLCSTQQIYQFDSNFIVVVYPNGETEQFEGNAIVNRIPYGDRLLTVAEFISELGLPSSMPTESRRGSYTFSRKVWLPNVKFAVEFNLPPPEPISKMALETMKRVVTKWIQEPAIPCKRKNRSV